MKNLFDGDGCLSLAAFLGRFTGKILKVCIRLADDVLLLAGCACILVGLAQWSIPATWIAGGAMLVGLAVLIGMRNAAH